MRSQVYVSVAKRKVLEALNLPQEYKALLSTDDRAALLHAVPLWRVSLKHMGRLLKHYRGRYNTIVGFQPTGWSMQTGRPPSFPPFQRSSTYLSTQDLPQSLCLCQVISILTAEDRLQ